MSADPINDAEENAEAPEKWPAITPLPPELPPAPDVDAELMPEPLRSWALDEAKRASAPVIMFAAPMIVIVSSLIGRKVGIYPKKTDESWLAAPNLWGGVVGRPGTLKSHALSAGLRFLTPLIMAAQDEADAAAQKHNEKMTEIMVGLAAAKQKLRNKIDKPDDLAAQITNFQLQLAIHERRAPTVRRYKTSDTTYEKLGELLIDNPTGLLIERDELTGLIYMLDRPGSEGFKAFLLEGWNGSGSTPFNVDRIGRGSLTVPPPCLAVLGGIQPEKLYGLINGSTQFDRSGDGFLQRLQLLVWPDFPSEFENDDRAQEAHGPMAQLFTELDAPRWTSDAFAPGKKRLAEKIFGTSYKPGDIPSGHFDAVAQRSFDQWRRKLERRIRSDEFERTPAFAGFVGKHRSLMPSLALIFHAMSVLSGKRTPGPVRGESVKLAIGWVRTLEAHAKRIYSFELATGEVAAHRLHEKIDDGEIQDGDHVRDIYRHEWSGLDSTTTRPGLSVLARAGCVRIERIVPDAGKPYEVVRLNPALKNGK